MLEYANDQATNKIDDNNEYGGDGIAEQEYVVIIGRIEAALSEGTGAPLMRVSRDMGMAVATVRDAIWKYHNQLKEILHESNIGI